MMYYVANANEFTIDATFIGRLQLSSSQDSFLDNTLRPEQNRHFKDNILVRSFLNKML